MSKWIAELELEDGDKMPEHMDLEYHGVKLDFHCRPIGKTYEDGLKEAWEAARTIVDCKVPYDFWELSSGQSMLGAFRLYSAKGAIEKIREYEEEQKKAAEIKIGDEVTDNDGWQGVVTRISPDGEYLVIIQKDGAGLHWKKESFKKTGRHFPQIAEVLKQMQEGDE